MGNCQVHSKRYNLQIANEHTFLFESANVIGNKYSAVFLEVTASLHLFSRKYLPNIQIWIHIVCFSIILSSKNDIPWKKQMVQFATQIIIQLFFFETVIYSSTHKFFMFTSYFVTQNIKACSQWMRINKINNF